MDLDKVLDGEEQETQVEASQETQVEDQTTQATEAELQTEATQEEEDQSATTAQADTNQKHVPLAALEAERKQRQDYKEKAARFEGELKAVNDELARLRQQAQQVPQQYHQEPEDPMVAYEKRIQTMHLNASERMARKSYGDESVDKAFAMFTKAVQENPNLHTAALSNIDPWEFVYQEGMRRVAMEEIGNDPAAYRQKLENELREKILAEAQSNPSNKLHLPQSLAGARSSASRNAPSFTGPTPLEDLLPK